MHRPALIPAVLVLLLLAGAVASQADDPPTVNVTVDTSGATTRVVLTHSRPIISAVTAVGGRLEIIYVDAVRIVPSAREMDDAILKGWSVRGDRTLVLETGSGYSGYDSFDLRNPPRKILDLQGTRTAAAPQRPARRERDDSKTVIVIDPGHGGVENGAIGPGGLREKDVALDLALRLKAILQRDSKFSVILTRDEDRHLELDERTAIANHNRADLFISIHLNASRRETAYGAETYFLSAEATDDEARILAGLENTVAGGVREEAGRSTGEKSGLDLVLWDLAQNQYLAESSALAEAVQKEMNRLTGTRDRGVRQAPFRVLMGATMPAILVEVGFISNADEERLLAKPEYRGRVVEALVRAVHQFQQWLETYEAPER